MLNRYWRWALCLSVFAIAVVGLTWAAPTGPLFPDRRADEATETNYQAGGPDCRDLPKPRTGEPTAIAANRIRCAKLADESRFQAQNLILQGRAVDAAAVQASLTYQSNRIAFIALLGGLATLAAAIAAAVYAKQAAWAARDTLYHSRAVAALELRPYLDFTGVRIRQTGDRPELVVNIENFGRVPATVIKVETGYSFVPKVGKFALPTLRDSRFDARTIAPGSSIESRHRSLLKAKNLAQVEAEAGRIVFYCRITYKDFNGTFEDILERAWMVRREHFAGDRTLARVHKTRHLLKSEN